MHRQDDSIEVLTEAIVRYSIDRLRIDPPPLDKPRSPADLRAMAGRTITPDGIGGLEALRIYGDVLGPACISVDHPRFLSFVPAAPTEASILFDLVVGASSVYAGSWLEGAGAIFAENEALRWIADLVGLPRRCRWRVRQRRHGWQPQRPDRGTVALAAPRRRRPRPHARVDRGVVRRPLVGGAGRAGDGRRRRARARRRARPAHRIGVARHGRGAVRRRSGPAVRDRGHRRHHERRGGRRPRRGGRGEGRTRHVAARRRRVRRRGPGRAERARRCSPGSSTPTASSSTRTSGCSHRSTRARCSTAIR